jgi:hypothetical protein
VRLEIEGHDSKVNIVLDTIKKKRLLEGHGGPKC